MPWLRQHARPVAFGVMLASWCAIYGVRAFQGHLALRTNAYDLSVFDYALWSSGSLGLGQVPFMGHSLFSHHFMPTLLALWPLYQLAPSPMTLLVIQLAAYALAAVLLYRLMPRDVPTLTALALLAAFLFGRRSHSAIASHFFVEGLEPLLIFAMLLAWRARRYLVAVAAGVLALGCKEDMPLYLATYGAAMFLWESRPRGAAIVAGAAVWLLVALQIAVPAARRHDNLPPASPFVEASFGSSEALGRTAERVTPGGVLKVVAMVTASTGFLCWLAPPHLLVALAAVFVTLLANPHSTVAGITGHYLFPILPWLFAAGAYGAARLQRAQPKLLLVVSTLLLLGTIADSPLWRAIGAERRDDERVAAAAIRRALADVPDEAAVLAMPNLVPHLAHRPHIWTISADEVDVPATHVVIATVGDLWPLDAAAVAARIDKYAADPRFRATSRGPLHVFERITP